MDPNDTRPKRFLVAPVTWGNLANRLLGARPWPLPCPLPPASCPIPHAPASPCAMSVGQHRTTAGITHAILAAILSRRALVLIVEFSPTFFPESGQVPCTRVP